MSFLQERHRANRAGTEIDLLLSYLPTSSQSIHYNCEVNRRIWQKRYSRYSRRGIGGPGSALARREWQTAADLWHRHVGHVEGWVIDFGAGNGEFWTLVEPSARLILSDVALEDSLTSIEASRIVMDATVPCIRKGSISAIVALGLLEYLPNLKETFKRWRWIAADDCSLVVTSSPPTVFNYMRFMIDRTMQIRQDEYILRCLAETGWQILDKPIRSGWQSQFVAAVRS